MPKLILLGDLAPAGLTNATWIDHEHSDSLVLGNLETPLCPRDLPVAPKAGPSLRADPAILRDVSRPFPRLLLNLANNHSMDHGPSGLRATMEHCRLADIMVVGAGDLEEMAKSPVFTQIEGLKIGCLGACERQFGIATHDTPGVADIGPDLFARIRALRPYADRVIVSIHGAAEMSPWPAPRWRSLLQAMIDAGADIVHGHHAHIPQGYEQHGAGWIVYSPGNTLVNPSLWPEGGGTLRSWRYVFDLLNLNIPPAVETWGVTQETSPTHVRIRKIDSDKARLAACNLPLTDPLLLQGVWQIYALQLWNSFYGPHLELTDNSQNDIKKHFKKLLRAFSSKFLPSTGDDRLTNLRKFHYHLHACEHHSEAIAVALAVLTGEQPDRRCDESRRLAKNWMPR